MATATLVLLLLSLALTISILRPGRPSDGPAGPGDHDRERLLADLRALPDYRPDVLPGSLTRRGTR